MASKLACNPNQTRQRLRIWESICDFVFCFVLQLHGFPHGLHTVQLVVVSGQDAENLRIKAQILTVIAKLYKFARRCSAHFAIVECLLKVVSAGIKTPQLIGTERQIVKAGLVWLKSGSLFSCFKRFLTGFDGLFHIIFSSLINFDEFILQTGHCFGTQSLPAAGVFRKPSTIGRDIRF